MTLPWLQPVWDRLASQRHALNHAVLLTGPTGIGKTDFAFDLAALLLCRSDGITACGHCQVCQLQVARTLPDLHVLTAPSRALWFGGGLQAWSERYSIDKATKAKPSERIRIDQIRLLLERIVGTPQIAGCRVVVIGGAEQMNEAAANALLKMLEEPPDGTWFLLVSDEPHRLPATIRSRCVMFALPAPTRDVALAWLAEHKQAVGESLLSLAAGGPLQAIRLNESDAGQVIDRIINDYLDVVSDRANPVAVAGQWPADDCRLLIRLLTIVTTDLIRIRTDSQSSHLNFPQLRDRLQAVAARLDLMKAHGLYARLLDSARHYDTALNGQMLLEDLLITCSQLTATQSR